MASGTATKAGYLYVVSRQGVYDAVKIGFTCTADPHAYVNDYARTLTPLEVISIVPAANARFAEALAHHTLAPRRLHDRHEVFDLSLPEGGFDQDLWQQVVGIVQMCDGMSKLPLPEDPQVLAQRREDADVQKREARAQQRQEAAEQKKRTKQEREEKIRRKKKATEARKQRRQKSEMVKAVKRSERDRAAHVLQEQLQAFVHVYCQIDAQKMVETTPFRETFEQKSGHRVTPAVMKAMMSQIGFLLERRRLGGHRQHQMFIGLSLNV